MYSLLRPLLFRLDAERAHERALSTLSWCARHPGALSLLRSVCAVRDERLEVTRCGLTFPNPIGLAAGFDKNGTAIPAWSALGFGFVEIGTVTSIGQQGNPKPRLFRLPLDRAIINRMGFNNEGAVAISERLASLGVGDRPVPLGINIGKSKSVPIEQAAEDYQQSLRRLWPYADYLVINVSSPNTPELRKLQDRQHLETILTVSKELCSHDRKPVFVKIAPELSWAHVDDVIELVESFGLGGIVACNTTLSRGGLQTSAVEAGGLSGRPLRKRSLELLRHICAHSTLPVISVGGISNLQDVIERLKAGACLVQLYTAMVYQGPRLVRELNRGLIAYVERQGYEAVEEIIASGISRPR
ncbi:MAG: quinone-dependent dihydroorotate dehydrogenase [Trueperaceae bacterium]|nr:MAG: quinone-dependent dihydroorotate dehydrogenase [Trueperaceae bacterium]